MPVRKLTGGSIVAGVGGPRDDAGEVDANL